MSELQPGPPFNQIVRSFDGPVSAGLKMKNSVRDGSDSSIGIYCSLVLCHTLSDLFRHTDPE
jgi:hypothetical protein